MTEENSCPYCGSRMKARWERLSPLLVRVLVKFYAAVSVAGKNMVSPSKDMNLSKTEYNNFQKLRFHAMIAKTEEAGKWLMTHRGAQFLAGQIQVPSMVKIFHNKIVEHGIELVTVKDVLGLTPFLDRKEDFIYEHFEPKQLAFA